jgi:Protein of unknown function (DUF998)
MTRRTAADAGSMRRKLVLAACSVGIAVMAFAIVIGPLFSPPIYSWASHTTSDQAGQHMQGAWVMRLGFWALGLSVLICCILDYKTRPLVRLALSCFGIGFIASAVWSNAPIDPQLAANAQEDAVHSVASWFVGMAFIGACVARLFGAGGSRVDPLAWMALCVSCVVPMLMAAAPDLRGVMQKAMFAVSLVFIAREFWGKGQDRDDYLRLEP